MLIIYMLIRFFPFFVSTFFDVLTKAQKSVTNEAKKLKNAS